MKDKRTRFEVTTPASAAKFALVSPEKGPEADGTEGRLPTLTGYAIVYNVPSSDDRRAVIAPGAVKFIESAPVLALYAHDSRDVLGSTANGTLRMPFG